MKGNYSGIKIGLLVAKMATDIRNRYKNMFDSYSIRAFYHPIFQKLPTETEWTELIEEQVALCLHVFSSSAIVPAKEKPKIYKKIKRLQGTSMLHMGEKLPEEMILERSYLGLYPEWMKNYSSYSEDFQHVHYFRNQYDLSEDLQGEKIVSFAKTIGASLLQNYKKQFTVRDSQNIMLNMFRKMTDSDDGYTECIMYEKPIITWDENCKCYFAIYNNGKKVEYEGPLLINYFSYGDNSLKIDDIVKSMNLDEKLSDDISDIQCNTGKIQTNQRMIYKFSLPSLFKLRRISWIKL